MNSYNKKLIVSGDKVELLEYKNPINYDFHRFKGSSKAGRILEFTEDGIICTLPEMDGKKRSQYSNTRAAANIRHLVNCNFTNGDKFVTLTYAGDHTDLTEANYDFNKFIKRLKDDVYPLQLKYFCVVEFQGDEYFRTHKKKEHGGNVHFHFLCNLPFFPKKKLEKIWGHGYVKIKRIKKVTNLGAYISKYLKKHTEKEGKRLAGRKKYFHSQNLMQPIITTDSRQIEEFLARTGCEMPDYESKGEFGDNEITYKQFTIDRMDYELGYFDPPTYDKLQSMIKVYEPKTSDITGDHIWFEEYRKRKEESRKKKELESTYD